MKILELTLLMDSTFTYYDNKKVEEYLNDC